MSRNSCHGQKLDLQKVSTLFKVDLNISFVNRPGTPKGGGGGRSTPNSRQGGASSKMNPATLRRDEHLPEMENHFILRMPQVTMLLLFNSFQFESTFISY